jgi:hypothetical protein
MHGAGHYIQRYIVVLLICVNFLEILADGVREKKSHQPLPKMGNFVSFDSCVLFFCGIRQSKCSGPSYEPIRHLGVRSTRYPADSSVACIVVGRFFFAEMLDARNFRSNKQ